MHKQLLITVTAISLIVCTNKHNVNNYEQFSEPNTVIKQAEDKPSNVLTVTLEGKEIKIIKPRKEQPDMNLNRGGQPKYMDFNITYYTNLPSENGGYTTNCSGEELLYGMVANNCYKLGTKIYLENLGTFTVADRGGKSFNVSNRLDIFIPRKDGETDAQYKARIYAMGVKTVKGYVLK